MSENLNQSRRWSAKSQKKKQSLAHAGSQQSRLLRFLWVSVSVRLWKSNGDPLLHLESEWMGDITCKPTRFWRDSADTYKRSLVSPQSLILVQFFSRILLGLWGFLPRTVQLKVLEQRRERENIIFHFYYCLTAGSPISITNQTSRDRIIIMRNFKMVVVHHKALFPCVCLGNGARGDHV